MGFGDGDRDMVAIKLPNQHALETEEPEQKCRVARMARCLLIIDRFCWECRGCRVVDVVVEGLGLENDPILCKQARDAEGLDTARHAAELTEGRW